MHVLLQLDGLVPVGFRGGKLAFQPVGQRVQGCACIADMEQAGAIGPAVCRGVDIDVNPVCWQLHAHVACFLGADARSGDQHAIDGLVVRLYPRHGSECAQYQRIGFRHHAAAQPRRYQRNAHVDEALHGLTREFSTVSGPEQGPFGLQQLVGYQVKTGFVACIGGRRFQRQAVEQLRARNFGALDVDRNFDADRAGWRGHGGAGCLHQRTKRAFSGPDAEGNLAGALQHPKLIDHVMHRALALFDIAGCGLAGQVQHR